MELSHLLELIAELPENTEMAYVRSAGTCVYKRIDTTEPKVYTLTPKGNEKNWGESYLKKIASKIKENVPFNLSQLLNNSGTDRAVIDTVIAYTREFYWLKKDGSIFTVWIPSKSKADLQLEEISELELKEIQNLSKASKRDTEDSKDIQYIQAIRTKPFLLLAGISGTGKSRIVRKLAQATVTEELQKKYDKDFKTDDFENDRWNLHRPANFELIQVKPNWHNSMDVIGYQSNLPSPHYEFTPFIHFIARAWKEKDKKIPFFLCLDEMNLAPVEEYFAEFLSAIESRDKESSDYVTDPLIKPFNQFGQQNAIDMITAINEGLRISDKDKNELGTTLEEQFRRKGLTLPPNLIVIGTVNMDETTFSFSRKVLDRAMSIEMNEVNYDTFLAGETDDGLKELVSSIPNLNKKLVDRPIQAKEILEEVGEGAEAVIEYLKRINALLDGTPFKLGYRVANEALLYLNASVDFGNPDWRDAMDKFTLMKILSRIEGDTNKLRIGNGEAEQKRLKASGIDKNKVEDKYGPLTILTALRVIIEDELMVTESIKEETTNTDEETESPEIVPVDETSKSKPRELESVKKLVSMISQLERERFVSYWN